MSRQRTIPIAGTCKELSSPMWRGSNGKDSLDRTCSFDGMAPHSWRILPIEALEKGKDAGRGTSSCHAADERGRP